MSRQFDTAVVIGRFQPFHLGHADLIDTALKVADKVVVILGSSHAARNCKNPFTADERAGMIVRYVEDQWSPGTADDRIEVIPMRDYYYSDALWVTDLQTKVRQNVGGKKVCLVGHKKDASSYYLDLFPSWAFVEHSPSHFDADNNVLGATEVRAELFSGSGVWEEYVPQTTRVVIGEIIARSARLGGLGPTMRDFWADLVAQYEYLREYPKQWGKGPFITADAVVTKAGHVLVVRRKDIPGKGLLAVPGGFLDPNERIVDCAIRELKEEANLWQYTHAELRRLIVAEKVFDHPNRSERGRTVTHAYHFDLDGTDVPGLPIPQAGDDAAEAFWMPLYEVLERPDVFYEDHQHIIRHFVSKV